MKETKKIYRDSDSGKFVKREDADKVQVVPVKRGPRVHELEAKNKDGQAA